MIGLSYEQIIEKIKTEKGLSEGEIKEKIDGKIKQLGDLISREGAAHIIAHELGVKVYDNIKRRLKIKELVPGITSVDIIGKVVNVYGVREFNKKNPGSASGIGKVGSFLLGDETGVVRIAVWDTSLIKHIEDGVLKDGVIIEVKNCHVKENNGFNELHLGNKAGINFDIDEKIEVKQVSRQINKEFKAINELEHGDNISINGYVVQVFEPRFYDSCSECNKKVIMQDGKGVCEEHGNVITRKIPIINFYIDDGTGNIRGVLFRDNAEKFIPGINDLREDSEKFNTARQEVVGKQVILQGKVVKNDMFDRKEIIANNLEFLDVNGVIEEIIRD